MKKESGPKGRANPAADSLSQRQVDRGEPPPLAVQFAAARANELADALYERAKDSIDWAQRSATHVSIETVWQRAQPLLMRTGKFVGAYPLRSAMIVALLAGAALLTRTPSLRGDK